MGLYVGLDAHSKQSVFVVQDEGGRVRRRGEVPTTREGLRQLRSRYAVAEGTPVALETGTVAFFVARNLLRLGLAPVVVDAREVRLKAHRPRQKSDRRDALALCEGLRRGIYQCIVPVPPEGVSALRETLSRRQHFVRLMTREVNAAKRLLRGAGLRSLCRSLKTETAWRKLLAKLEPEGALRDYIEMHAQVWRCAQQKVAVLETSLERQEEAFAEVSARLQQLPGVGQITALTAVAVLYDASRFPTSRHVGSYAGLVPCTDHSGDRQASGGITKRGSAALRAVLCEAAQHARKPDHPLNPYFAKVFARRGDKVATVAVAHRLLRVMYAMMRDGSDFDLGRLGVERGPYTRKTTRLYRLKAKKGAAAAMA